MKTKILPSINVQNFNEFRKRINLLKGLTDVFHLDVANLEFTGDYQTWRNPQDLDKIEDKVFFDVHLMITLERQDIFSWSKKNIKRLILHLEGNPNANILFKLAKKTGKKIIIAWSPQVEFDFIERYLKFSNGILILGVKPGKSGQDFLEATYQRIEQIKKNLKKSQELIIDGGINKNNLKKILSYQPDIIVIGSAIFNTPDPKKTYLEFMNAL